MPIEPPHSLPRADADLHPGNGIEEIGFRDVRASERFFLYLSAALPDLYDFAVRLLRSTPAAEHAIETGLRVILRMPSTSIDSEPAFRARAFSETYLVAESGQPDPDTSEAGLSDVINTTFPRLDDDTGRLVWKVASRLAPQEYAAIHLHSRLGLNRDGIADSLGVTAAYAFVLLGRAQRHFVDAIQAALLARGDTTCAFVAQLQEPRGAEVDGTYERQIAEHLAAGCMQCKASLAPFGDAANLLGMLASAVPPDAMLDRLSERLRDRAESLDGIPSATGAPGAFAGAGALATGPTAATPTSSARLHDRKVWLPLVMVAEAVLLLGGVAIFGVATGRNGSPPPEVTVLGASTSVSAPSEDVVASEEIPQPEAENLGDAPAVDQSPTPGATAPPRPAATISVATPATQAAGIPVPADIPTPPSATATQPPPRLSVSAPSLVFGPAESLKTIELQNAGAGSVTWDVRPQQAWILVSPSGGTFTTGSSLQVRVDRSFGGRGPRQGAITVSSSAGTVIVPIVAE